LDLDELRENAKTDELKRDMDFILAIRNARVDDRFGLKGEPLNRIRNPPRERTPVDDPAVRLAIHLYDILCKSSDQAYHDVRGAIQTCFPDIKILSLHNVKQLIRDLTGLDEVKVDMCTDACVAFDGPYADLEHCPHCGISRYDPKKLARSNGKNKIPRKVTITYLVGPMIQARWRHRDSAWAMEYRNRRTQALSNELVRNHGLPDRYEDFITGTSYVNAVRKGLIRPEDTTLIGSTDGAQLYAQKDSDVWVLIWIFTDISPDTRYKKKSIMIGVVIPGPNHPKYLPSFLFRSFHHISALQKEGLRIWDGYANREFLSRVFLALLGADGPGLLAFSNLVGHNGLVGCRMHCPLEGRRFPGSSTYYPVLISPEGYTLDSLGDISPYDLSSGSSERYIEQLKRLMKARNKTHHATLRKQTGIVGPSMVLGLQPGAFFGIPECF
ncbi:hypothetical protein CONPUDRAFT_35022, partial [Coniophora puteana RWD-64-598 SS2]